MLGAPVGEQQQIDYQMMAIGVRQLVVECSDDPLDAAARINKLYLEKRAFQAASPEAMNKRTEVLAQTVRACHDTLTRDVLREAIDRSMKN